MPNWLKRAGTAAAGFVLRQTHGAETGNLVTQNLDDLVSILKGVGFDSRGFPITDDAPVSMGSGAAVSESRFGYQYAAMRVLCNAALRSPLHIETRDIDFRTGESTWAIDDSHDAAKLLAFVNPHQTWPELQGLTVSFLFTVGSAFWFREMVGGRTVGLWPLDPQNMKAVVTRDKDRGGSNVVQKWVYTMETKGRKSTLDFEIDELVRFVEPHPSDMLNGYSRERAAAGGIRLAREVVTAQYWSMLNAHVPSVIVEMKEDSKAKRDEWFEAIEQKLKGAKKTATVLGIPMDKARVTPMQERSREDVGYQSGSEISRDNILGPMLTPQALLGITRDTSKANVEGAETIYAKYNVSPLLTAQDARINQDYILKEFGDDVRARHEDSIPKDREADIRDAEVRLKNGDSWNSVASDMGWAQHDWGDTWYKPIGLEPVDAPDEEEQAARDREAATAQTLRAAADERGLGYEERRAMFRMFRKVCADGFAPEQAKRPATLGYTKPRLLAKPKGVPAGFSKMVRRRIDKIIRRTSKRIEHAWSVELTKHFEALGRDMLGEWDAKFGDEMEAEREAEQQGATVRQQTPGEIEDILRRSMDPEHVAQDLAERSEPFVARGIVAGGDVSRSLYDASLPEFTLDNPAGQVYVNERTTAYWAGPAQESQRQIKQIVFDGLQARQGLREIRETLEQRFASWVDPASSRPLTIARTETTKIMNAGTQAFMDTHEIEWKQWVASFVHTRDTHARADGQVRRRTQMYQVGADAMLFPGAGSMAGENVNCHCNSVAIPAPKR